MQNEAKNEKDIYYAVVNVREKTFSHCGDNGGEAPPVPIPNTAVKLSSAESTWLDTTREARTSPHTIKTS